MRLWACVLVGMVSLSPQAHALGHSKQIKTIQHYCDALNAEFADTAPDVFSGPEPWTELDALPSHMPDTALAMVYPNSTAPLWVFLRLISSDQDQWSEDVSYYFAEDGTVAKRERHLQIAAANVSFVETNFYDHGKLIKTKTHHQALVPGKQNLSAFVDQPAPDYLSVDDLPFADAADSPERSVGLRKCLIKIPN